jgi:hypothetical protein
MQERCHDVRELLGRVPLGQFSPENQFLNEHRLPRPRVWLPDRGPPFNVYIRTSVTEWFPDPVDDVHIVFPLPAPVTPLPSHRAHLADEDVRQCTEKIYAGAGGGF